MAVLWCQLVIHVLKELQVADAFYVIYEHALLQNEWALNFDQVGCTTGDNEPIGTAAQPRLLWIYRESNLPRKVRQDKLRFC